jgi:hypothetical protein
MSSQSASDIGARKVRVFSAVWSEELGAAIAAAAPIEGYTMSLVGEDGRAVITAVNRGIDAHLGACFVPDRGDRYGCLATQDTPKKVPGNRLECVVSPESLVTLVRRLMQADDPAAESLAAGICQTLDLELV